MKRHKGILNINGMPAKLVEWLIANGYWDIADNGNCFNDINF